MINCLKKQKKLELKFLWKNKDFKDEFDDLDEVCKHLVVLNHQKAIERVAIIMMILYKQMLLEE